MGRRAAAVAVVAVLGTLTVSSPTFARLRGLHLHPTAQELTARAAARTGARRLSGARAWSGKGMSGPTSVASVPDGSGGLYIAWEDFRDGTSDIYALRVTNAGTPAPGWPADGLPVCTAVGEQYSPVLLPDGSHGVIVGWSDFRDNALVGDGYAQRVTSTGTALWAVNGVKGVSGITVQDDVAIAGDSSGGFIVAWSELGLTDLDIFAVHFDGTGSLVTGWNAAGSLVCDAAGDQTSPAIAPAAAGGALIGWEDPRDVSGVHHVYAQLMNGSGVAQWSANGVLVDASTAGASGPAACSDGSSGTILFWSDLDDLGAVVAQRLNSSGVAQWGAGVVASGSYASDIEATADGLGGGIATWLESGTGVTMMTQRVDGAGALQWGLSGTTLVTSATGFPTLGDVVPDGVGGAYFAWVDSPAGFESEDIYAQRLNGAGAFQWAAGGVAVCSADGSQLSPTAALDGTGGLLLAWVDQRSLDPEIYAQRLNGAGTAQFAANGLAVFTNPGLQVASRTVAVTTDVAAWTVWMQKQNGQYDLRAHAINGAGPTGSSIDVCAAAGHQILDAAIGDGAGGVIVAWTDGRSGRDDIYAQRLDNFGVPQWGANGLAVCIVGQHQRGASMIPDDAGGAILVWEDQRTPGNPDIYAQRINSTGAALWGANGIAVCNDPGYQTTSVAAPDGAGGAIVSWLDLRSFLTPAIYAQRLNATGATQWTANGVSIATAPSFPILSGAVADGANGAIMLMNDFVLDPVSGSVIGNRLWAQRVDPTGAPLWGAGGTVVCDANASAGFERVVSNGSSGAYIAWSDARDGVSDIYGQRVNSGGAVQWGVNGTAICNAAGWQTLGGITRDGLGNLLLTWMDERSGFPDVYADRVSPSGTTQWNANGVAVSTATRGQALPSIGEWNAFPPDHAYISWTDNRAGNARYIYAQELDTNGAGQGTADGVVPVLISVMATEADPGQVRLSWYASTSVTVTIYRRTSDGIWAAIGHAAADGRGMIEFVDQDVRAGGHYGYRLGVREAGSETFSNDVWVDVPPQLALTLTGLCPNPASRELVVSYALPTAAPARLEMFDLSGRRLRVEELRGLTPGLHSSRFEGALPPPGLYFLRLTQAGRSVMARGAVTR